MNYHTSKSRVPGEREYVPARKYRQAARAFAGAAQVEQTARNAALRSSQEPAGLCRIETEGRSYAEVVSADPAQGLGTGEPGKPVPDKLPVAGR